MPVVFFIGDPVRLPALVARSLSKKVPVETKAMFELG
jgi:hypothetical protein